VIETGLAALPLLGLIFFVAAVYSAVGHGGASGYLAILSLFSFPAQEMSSTALLLNVLVSSLAFWSFWKGGHKLPKFAWLLVIASIPLSFVGGALTVGDNLYKLLLAFALTFAAVRLASASSATDDSQLRAPKPLMLLGAGGGIGLLSGIVGVGGGIFLSPLAVLSRWTTVKSAATLSAMFILVNSLAGLAGRAATDRLVIAPAVGLMLAAFAGGLIGSRLGARRFGAVGLRRLLAFVLVIAAAKLAFVAF